eukprot:CAMPEP_0202877592 /NCGR_PEP_ID=MMETSP1391-20130828/30907_1 /ASSEMBLY_ACC=CAM_ASM_000867 /TAXON_ID=1034604 /ORGANISM="Chlamydomonas leiostraca, Strain SAG 11-49" /LENGTH=33 /DNA_ID= /DNA_START= /DNA_END= /DNA_ORIENTATION=
MTGNTTQTVQYFWHCLVLPARPVLVACDATASV